MGRATSFAVPKRTSTTARVFAFVLFVAGAISAPAMAANTASPGELVVSKSSGPATTGRATPAADRAKGVVWQGLSTDGRTCPQGFALSEAPGLCSHGPDAAPAGVDVSRPRSTADLVATTDEGSASSSSSTWSVPCYGDGVTGKRVQVVYAHASDVADRFADLASSIVAWAGNIDVTFNDSAAETGGVRHVRYVTDSGCNLVIQRVQLSTMGDDSFGNTINELQSVGLTRADRKYLVWTDATFYCGIAQLYNDDSAGLTNANNTNAGYARIDSGCWGSVKSSEAHELMHLMGGVQYTAPHTSGGGHCTDEYDRMCYVDASGVTMNYVCTSSSHDRLFDCNHDDYYTTSAPAGSYLASHWNAASSSWLESVAPPAWSPKTTTTTPSPSPSASASPSPSPSPSTASTTTVTFSGSLSRKVAARTYDLPVGTGTVSSSLTFAKASSLTETLRAPNGSTVASKSGPSPVPLSASVSGGTYSIVVSGSGNASFTLTVTYPNP